MYFLLTILTNNFVGMVFIRLKIYQVLLTHLIMICKANTKTQLSIYKQNTIQVNLNKYNVLT